ncbi:MAG: SusC/RagA family TonB-linked outer membrane protein [Bacteroidales bacterium]|nr:SusC/RagA family TonB-linked outer membrane protein [Bacteroidales bacterium]
MGFVSFAQNRLVSGKVVDGNGEPVAGASVVVVGQTSMGTATDMDGTWRLSVPDRANISISCIGYVSQTVSVAGRSVIDVTLEEDSEFLEETVVIGYGVQKKSDLTGAVASVRSDDLVNRSTTDAAAALQGKAAGIQVLNTSGAPGEGASIRVRGYSSNSGSIGPLLIVDGLKVDNIQYLDPSMIESMEVLKDAASAAIYGAQAGNGVVLITTKTGAANNGTAHITYNGRFTLQSLGKKAEIFGAKDYIEYQTYIGNLSDELLKANGYNGTDTNWYDATFQPSWAIQHGITIQGGNNKGHFLTALNYVNDDGIVVGKKDVYQRLTAQINADYQLFKWFNVSSNTSFEKWSRKSVSSGYGSVLNSVVSIDPLTPPYISRLEDTPGGMQEHYAAGDPIPRDPLHNNDFYGTSKYLEEATGNPLFQRDKTDSSQGGINIRGTLAANLMPFNGMTITSRFGYRIADGNSHSYSTPYWLTAMANDKNYSISANVNTSYYYQWENFANYLRTFGKHTVGAMVGMSYTESHSDNASISSSGPDILKGYDENFRYIDYLTSDATKSVGNAPSVSAQLSYYGRLQYGFDNRYNIQANFRADAYDSSKLSKQARWGYFPSVSAGWTISNEPWFRDNVNRDAVSFLKLRGSWGINGNINVLSGYRYSTSITLNGEMYQYDLAAGDGRPSYGSRPSGLANPDLKWETSEQLDFGLDARFLRNRLTFTADWYRKFTNDLLVSIAPLPEIGVSSTTVNAGKVLNTGLEFELGWKDQIGDFAYSVNANLSTLHNEVLEVHALLDRLTQDPVSGLNEKLQTAFEQGYPIWYFRGFKYDGVDQATGAPKYLDKDGKSVATVTDNDKVYLGEGIPNLTYGITVNLAYKGFDLVVFGTGVAGNEIYNLMVSADRPKVNSLTTYWKNSWGNPNVEKSTAKYPDMKQVAASWDFFSSDACIFDGSFFKIKQIQLGYTFPRRLTQKALISDLRLFVSMDDYFTFTKYPGADPETASYNNSTSRGVDSGSYPTMKKMVFGVNLTF